jgi:hypothetical protein
VPGRRVCPTQLAAAARVVDQLNRHCLSGPRVVQVLVVGWHVHIIPRTP